MRNRIFNLDDRIILLTTRVIEGYECILHKDYKFSKSVLLERNIRDIDVLICLGHFLQELHPEMSPAEGNLSSINNIKYLLDNMPEKPKCIVYCSTMALYGIHRKGGVDETSTLQIDNVYAASKCFIEHYLKEECKKFDINLQILRLAHIYGPQDKRNYTIPIWLKAARNNEAIKLFTNPNQSRNCLYIDDCCRFIGKAAYLRESVGIINVVSEHNATMGEIAEICKTVSENKKNIVIEGKHPTDIGLSFLNADKRKKYLGNEEYDLRIGLTEEYKYLMNL